MSSIRVLFESDVIEIDGEVYHHHPKGGGLVSRSAHVAATAYIGPEVTVSGRAQVLDRVRLEGAVRVSGDA
ncbi:MAG: hypothetical protein WAM71_14765, partial [Candidatus Korobacteraceae bacterium]